jgi:hypothetical protein
MPGVNRICNTKMSQCGVIFELLLRQDAAPRNIPNSSAKRHADCASLGR